MQTLSDLIKEKISNLGKKEKCLNERQTLLKELYEVYASPTQKNFRRKENWNRYVNYLKANHINEKVLGRTETIKLWRKKGKKEFKFLKEMTPKELAILLSPFSKKNNNMDVLYYLRSLGKDMENRGENFSSFLMWSIYNKPNGEVVINGQD